MNKCNRKNVQKYYPKDELIGIFGDYDVDGASSTAITFTLFFINKTKNSKHIFLIDKQKVMDLMLAAFKKLIIKLGV